MPAERIRRCFPCRSILHTGSSGNWMQRGKSEYIRGILPDGKAQVTVEYEDEEPVRVDTVIVILPACGRKSLKELEQEIRQKVLLPALRPLPADPETKIIINPSGRFVVGGMEADTGLDREKADG